MNTDLVVGQRVLVQIFPYEGSMWILGTIEARCHYASSGNLYYSILIDHTYYGGNVLRDPEILIPIPKGATEDQIEALVALTCDQ